MNRGLLWAALTILCWGPMFPIAKRAMAHVDAFALSTLRYSFGVVLLILVLWWLEGARALRYEGRFLQGTFAGLLGITGFNALVWFGLTSTRPEHASIIMALQTPMTAIAVWLLHGTRPARFTLACIGLAIAGVALVVTAGDPTNAFGGGSLVGDAIVLAGAVMWVGYTLLSQRFAGWSPLRFTVLTCIPGGIGLVLVNAVLVAAGFSTVPSGAAVAEIAWQLVYFIFGSVVFGIVAFNQTVRQLGPLNTMLMLNLIPVTVFAIEAALGRSYVALELTGAAMVVGALIANNLYLRSGAKRSR
jgi:drug/metabolite transporter (DMT)-like permease